MRISDWSSDVCSSDLLNALSKDFFAGVTAGLDALGIRYQRNPHLVRGFDYYCHSAFEFVTDALGAQGTVLAGGRYDGLVETLGGPPIPGVGRAAGLERLEIGRASVRERVCKYVEISVVAV